MWNRIAGLSVSIVVVALLAFLLPSCGGGSRSDGTRSGVLKLTVKWPAPSKNRLIPAASNSIKATLTGGNASLGTQMLTRPSQPPWDSSVTFNNLPAGPVVLTATAMPNADGTGTAQASGSAPASIIAGQTVSVTVTMGSTIDHLSLTPANPSVDVAATQQLTMTAFDAAGSVVLVAPANVTWQSGTPANATVDGNGMATGVAAGTSVVTVAESESGKSANTTVTVNAPVGGCVPGVVTGPGGIAVADWPKAGADIRNTGRGKGSGATGVLKWAVSTNSDSGGFQVTIGPDGTLYHTTYGTATTSGTLTARNPADGSVKWSFTASSGQITTIPTVGRNGLVFFSDVTNLYAIDAQTGAQRWAAAVGGSSALPQSATIGLDGTVYVAGGFALRALDGDTGAEKWKAHSGDGTTGWYWTSPAVGADGTLYVAKTSGGLAAIDGKNGCTRWTVSSAGSVGGTAVADDGTVYATVQPQVTNIPPTRVIAVDPATGAIKWTTDNVPGQNTPPAIGQDGTVYVLGPQCQLTALSPATGAIKWTFQPPGGGGNRASPAIGADGTIYILCGSILGSSLSAIDPATGTQKWSFTVPNNGGLAAPQDATPTISADGTIYVCTFGPGAGQVIAVH